MSESRKSREIFGPRRDDVIGGWRIFNNEGQEDSIEVGVKKIKKWDISWIQLA
jgi:hypothetical protein